MNMIFSATVAIGRAIIGPASCEFKCLYLWIWVPCGTFARGAYMIYTYFLGACRHPTLTLRP
ncbi:hypothetical protein BOTBODRAFT_293348 [Botryobasidium botryosum FD-172 SS1]|uniref:Uncharacterized protein n=1 Tax=Botryobasidium botryosum (strain FD-172 SS1) TaxID=930990 RepID=A0A067ML96_BOTB1|nr:hypothetical protein BOTBODRAFT_293348 [Botryobasidium botryosum FD-172 SS1]